MKVLGQVEYDIFRALFIIEHMAKLAKRGLNHQKIPSIWSYQYMYDQRILIFITLKFIVVTSREIFVVRRKAFSLCILHSL